MRSDWMLVIFIYMIIFVVLLGFMVYYFGRSPAEKKSEQVLAEKRHAEYKARQAEEKAARKQRLFTNRDQDIFQRFKNWCILLILFLVMILVLILCFG